MGFAQLLCRGQVGLSAPLVRVEVHLGSGLPTFSIVGLPAPVVRESKERVRAALAQCGFEFPAGRITVNLAPADLPKEGGRFDLPVALGILIASGQVEPPAPLERTEFYGELALTGELKPVPGLLLAALHAAEEGHDLFVPAANLPELALTGRSGTRGLRTLADLLEGATPGEPQATPPVRHNHPGSAQPDLADVRGQWQARRALVIAAAGGHSLLLSGPPGSGKSMLARRLPGLLPPLSRAESLQVAAVAAAAQLPLELPMARPFRSPHHTASAHAIVGGGPVVRPGEISLAHLGVLFLDELPEFDRRVLEALREPLESGVASIVRARQRAEFPAQFQLVAAMNPCPCGHSGLAKPGCRCSKEAIARYRARISGPLLDRIDLQLQVPPVDAQALAGADDQAEAGRGLTTARARQAVCAARELALARQGRINAQLGPEETLRHCRADAGGMRLLRQAAESRGMSARAQHRVLRVARSLADLRGAERPGSADVAEALALRWEE